jgi:hypothetical protein
MGRAEGDEDGAQAVVRLVTVLVEAHGRWLLAHWTQPGVQEVWGLLIESIAFPGVCPVEQTVRRVRPCLYVPVCGPVALRVGLGVRAAHGVTRGRPDAAADLADAAGVLGRAECGRCPGAVPLRRTQGSRAPPYSLSRLGLLCWP